MAYQYVDGARGGRLKMWCEGVEVEADARTQLDNIAALPFIAGHVAVMPDVHLGKGATVGSVIPTVGAVVPAAVGVDIGCGMMAVRLSLTANDLPDNLHSLRSHIESVVPHGRTDNGGANDVGTWNADIVSRAAINAWAGLKSRYEAIVAKHPKIASHKTYEFMGTLGTGNHFIELCLDEEDRVWVMLHSGSRGVGNKIGTYFIEAAKREMERYHILPYLPDSDLSYLVENTTLFDDYVEAVSWAQEFAALNRQIMMDAVLGVLRQRLPAFSISHEKAVNCHHNYIAKENHFGKNVWVTRKGAVRARKDDLGIIPGSMGTGSFIVRGLGNQESFCSCSHGAGRRMSRNAARKAITLEDHIKATEGIECRKDVDVIDESPAAYKDIGAVMAAQDDLVEIVHRLRQVLNVKG
jgi:tRNA-splicing ligase RtcB